MKRELPFSILGRIGGDATCTGPNSKSGMPNFQYPRSDRRRCNEKYRPVWIPVMDLSVSSVGSEAMQR